MNLISGARKLILLTESPISAGDHLTEQQSHATGYSSNTIFNYKKPKLLLNLRDLPHPGAHPEPWAAAGTKLGHLKSSCPSLDGHQDVFVCSQPLWNDCWCPLTRAAHRGSCTQWLPRHRHSNCESPLSFLPAWPPGIWSSSLLRAVRGVRNCSSSHCGYFGILLTTYNKGLLIKARQSEASLVIGDVCSADWGNSLQVKFEAAFPKKTDWEIILTAQRGSSHIPRHLTGRIWLDFELGFLPSSRKWKGNTCAEHKMQQQQVQADLWFPKRERCNQELKWKTQPQLLAVQKLSQRSARPPCWNPGRLLLPPHSSSSPHHGLIHPKRLGQEREGQNSNKHPRVSTKHQFQQTTYRSRK